MFNESEELQEYFKMAILAVKGLIVEMSEDDELLTSIAKLSKKLFDKYKEVGFTDEQAFELVSKSDLLKSAGNNK